MNSKTDRMVIDQESDLKVVLPGDPIDLEKKESLKLGPGLTQTQDSIICIKAGILNHSKDGKKVWVDSNQKRYIPVGGESVLGIVTYKGGEFYRLDIGSAHQATLSNTAFENATKKNRPILNIGSLVYARVSSANKDMEPELECINPSTNKADGFGELEGGYVIKCSLRYCRK
ncbi:7829_t:CDS:2 [Funneliformis mosseae]|uniref:7829_t:CDS:1 n=1 Tax=Funneliformis mosseae TaxID=27381 RepID=A0A9N9A5L3_FUNMO|nr:7829_t:CDS:2 [Funneliformis mosseae]